MLTRPRKRTRSPRFFLATKKNSGRSLPTARRCAPYVTGRKPLWRTVLGTGKAQAGKRTANVNRVKHGRLNTCAIGRKSAKQAPVAQLAVQRIFNPSDVSSSLTWSTRPGRLRGDDMRRLLVPVGEDEQDQDVRHGAQGDPATEHLPLTKHRTSC